MKNEKGAVLLAVMIMITLLIVMSDVALRMTLQSRIGNTRAKAGLQQEADRLPALKR